MKTLWWLSCFINKITLLGWEIKSFKSDQILMTGLVWFLCLMAYQPLQVI